MDSTVELLKALTEAPGVPGYEAPVRAVVRKYLEPLGTLSQDKIGSVICRQPGSAESPRVMLAGHMDEIGFMVKHITEDGFIKFLPLGGWFDQVLLGQRVVIKTRQGEVIGVIGAKPPHLLSPTSARRWSRRRICTSTSASPAKPRSKPPASSRGSVYPSADFVELANGKTYLSKAFDDRVGVALMVAALEQLKQTGASQHLYGVATVMEEVGLRGATTSVRAVDPDVAIVLESDIAGDVPGIKPEELTVKLGKGPTLIIFDARMIPNLQLRDLILDIAKEIGVPVQISYIEGGATDGGVIHLHATGVPTVVIGVAARHIHSHSSIIHRDDFDAALKLLVALVQRLDKQTVMGLTVIARYSSLYSLPQWRRLGEGIESFPEAKCPI